jgi:hypothetical protein
VSSLLALFYSIRREAAEASIAVGGKCASLAAQVTHGIFYLDVAEGYLLGHPPDRVD